MQKKLFKYIKDLIEEKYWYTYIMWDNRFPTELKRIKYIGRTNQKKQETTKLSPLEAESSKQTINHIANKNWYFYI